MDQALFLETLKAIVTVAKTENNYMTKEQIKKYMKDSGLELEEDKFAFIYQYLGENGVAVEGFGFKPVKRQLEEIENDTDGWNKSEKDEKKEVDETDWQNKKEETLDISNQLKESTEQEFLEEDSVYLKMYLLDLENIPVLDKNEKLILWTKMKNGNDAVSKQLMEGYFHEVVDIVKEYRNKGVNFEDLIQEGNMALLQAFESIKQFDNVEKADGFLKASIKEGIERLIDMETNDSDWEHTMLAKINLIHEAAKHLAKELGRGATVQELADYTKMTEEEIEDVKQLSKDVL